MISSFFSKTKPINYVIVLGFCTLLYILMVSVSAVSIFENGVFLPKIISLFFLLLTFLVINPTLKADKLAELSSFTMLFYVLLLAVFLPMVLSGKIVISNFLLLLATDKVLALKFEKNTKYKIFEASLFVFLSSVVMEWTVVFLIPMYIAIYVYCGKQLRNWLIPLAAMVVCLMGVLCYSGLFNDWGFIQGHYAFKLNGTFDAFAYIGILCYFFLALVIMFIVLVKLGNRGMGRILSLRILFAYFVLGILLVFVSEESGSNMILYTLFPISVFLTNYFETIRDKRFKEGLLSVMIITSLIIAGFNLVQ